jgi:hypothetical protein
MTESRARARAWTSLLRKELRELRPWAILSVCMGLADPLELLFGQTDMQPLARTIGLLGASSGLALWIMAFAIGTGLGPREQDDRTLAFLDSLPVSRTRVFFTKTAVTCALLWLAPVMTLLGVLAVHGLSRGSLDAPFHLKIVLGRFGLQCAAIVCGVTLGTLFGWLRSLTWLVLGVAATLIQLLTDKLPRAAMLNPSALLEAPITSAGLSVDLEALWVQLGLALVSMLLGWRAFLRAGQGGARLDLRDKPVLGALATLLTVSSLLAAMVVAALRSDPVESEEEPEDGALVEPTFAEGPPAHTASKHYHFSYPAARAQQAQALVREADGIFERVHGLLGVAPGASIAVDASGSMDNTEGTAYYERLRMALGRDDRIVLAHETAHVVAQRLAGAERDVLWQQASVLNEGLATWVEQHFAPARQDPAASAASADAGAFDEAQERRAGRLALAALNARGELFIEELANPERLALLRDDALKYPAGAALITAIVRTHGAPALPRLLRAFADESLPVELRGLELWQATFQLAGIDSGRVFDAFFREVARDETARAEEIAALPRPRVGLVKRDGSIGARAFVDHSARQEPEAVAQATRLTLRFKPAPDSGFDDYEVFRVQPGESVWRQRRDIQGGRICVQAGLLLPPDQVLYEPWMCLPTSDAEECLECEGAR